jgi:uroporphyrinogen-III synthase
VSGGLAGRRVLLTRRWPELVASLSSAGATVAEVPALALNPPSDSRPLDAALRALPDYEWVVFTSAHAVDAVVARMEALGVTMPAGMRMASVGPVTSQAILAAWPGAHVEVQPESEFRGLSLVAAFAGRELRAQRMLLPVSDRAADVVEKGLAARGARVDQLVAYQTTASDSRERFREELHVGLDLVAFASPSAVEAFCAAVGEASLGAPAVVIGPTTADAARAAGLDVLAVADTADSPGMMRALERAMGGARRG